jgi:CDP-glycerol glycerophosphotransferase (TagB/SpsB family)
LNVSYDEIGRVSKCINYSAKKSGVKTILIQHGALAEYPLYGSFCADIFALYGENSARIYKNLGVEDKQLKIVGNIRFDELFSKMKSYNRESTLNKIGVQTNKKVILFTSQPVTYEENELLLNEIFSEFSKLPKENYHLVIKLHPAEDGRLHNNIAKSFDNYTIIKDIDIFEIIHASDLVITYWSTTGLEAMVLGKPVIVLNLSGKPDKVAYARTGAALGVYKKGHLKQSILKCLYNLALRKKMFDKQKNFIFSESYKIDGKASERIINLINEMIKT